MSICRTTYTLLLMTLFAVLSPSTSYGIIGPDGVEVGAAEIYFMETTVKGRLIVFPKENKAIAGYSLEGVPFIVVLPRKAGLLYLGYAYVEDGGIKLEEKQVEVKGKDDGDNDDGDDDDGDDDDGDNGGSSIPFLELARKAKQQVDRGTLLQFANSTLEFVEGFSGEDGEAFREGLRRYNRLTVDVTDELEQFDNEEIGPFVDQRNPKTVDEYKSIWTNIAKAIKQELE